MPETAPLRPVWLASYPRSGNTFLRILLEKVFHLPTYSLYRIEGQEFPDPSADALEEAPYLPRNWDELVTAGSEGKLTLIKTHGPPQDDAPAIYLTREGRAAVDSYYHYHEKFAFEKPTLTEVIAGACQFGNWSEHYLAWQPQQRPRTLFLRYEDLVSKPEGIIPRIAEFLQLPPATGKLPSFEELQARFPSFFRRGRNDDFLREWQPGQLALFQACHGRVMKTLGYPEGTIVAPDAEILVELARGSARLHRLYLEQLSRLGAAAASQQRLAEQVVQAGEQIRELCTALEDKRAALEFLSSRRWVRLGRSLRLLATASNGGSRDAGAAPQHSPGGRPAEPHAPKALL